MYGRSNGISEWSKASRKDEGESSEFPKFKSRGEETPSFTCTARQCIWVTEPFVLKKDNSSHKYSIESSTFLSHKAEIFGKFKLRKDSKART